MTITVIGRPTHSLDRCWTYTRAFGWLPVPGTQPRTPRDDVPIRYTPTLPPRWTP